MKLNQILDQYPEFSLATRDDNKDILQFYHSHQMQTTGLQIFYDRGDDFFEHLSTQGDNVFVFIYRDEKGELKGIGTISSKEQIVNQSIQKTLYLGDLRSETSRDVSKRWKRLYSEMMKHINKIEEFDSPYNFTVIMHSNLKAIKALVKNQNNFEYVYLDDFEMINVFCKTPLVPNQSKYRVMRLKNVDELKDFMNIEGIKYQLGLNYDLFKKRFHSYQGLKIEDVLLVKDGDEIIGSTIMWEPSPQKKIVLKNLPWFLKVFNFILSFITAAPKVGQELRINYLNDLIVHSSYNKSDVVQSILSFLNKQKVFKVYHAIAFASFKKDPIRVKGFLQDKTKLLFYTVRTSGREDILDFDKNINFNLSWV